MNPMSEFKKSFTKEYEIQGKKFLFRALTAKEASDVDKAVFKNVMLLSDEALLNTRKIETLAIALVSVDNIPLSKFDNIQTEVSKGNNEKELIKEEIGSWDNSLTTVLYLYYLDMIKDKDSKLQKDVDFLNK